MKINEELLSAIFNVGRLIKEEIRESNCLSDFTQSEIEVLRFLDGKKDTTMRQIAEYLHVKPSSTTSVIENLVKKGSLKRFESKDDRRIIYIALTQKGLKTLQKKYKTIHKTIGKIFYRLNNKDKRNLIKIFKKIHAENI